MTARNILVLPLSLVSVLLLMPVLMVGGGLWIIVALTKWITRIIEPISRPWDQILEHEPIIGWKQKPNLNTWHLAAGDDVCHTVTDDQGWMGKSSLEESDIVVFGDSFAFCYGVDIEESFVSINPTLKVKSIGSNGYSMVQSVLLMRQLSSQLKGKTIVWFVCVENDIQDNVRPYLACQKYRAPFVRKNARTDKWEIVTDHVNSSPWFCPPLREDYAAFFPQLFMSTPIASYAYSACEYLMQEAQMVCQDVGARLVVMTIPKKHQLSLDGIKLIANRLRDKTQFHPEYLDDQFQIMCNQLNIGFVSLSKVLRLKDYRAFDWHWNKEGHQKVSRVLSDIFEQYENEALHSK